MPRRTPFPTPFVLVLLITLGLTLNVTLLIIGQFHNTQRAQRLAQDWLCVANFEANINTWIRLERTGRMLNNDTLLSEENQLRLSELAKQRRILAAQIQDLYPRETSAQLEQHLRPLLEHSGKDGLAAGNIPDLKIEILIAQFRKDIQNYQNRSLIAFADQQHDLKLILAACCGLLLLALFLVAHNHKKHFTEPAQALALALRERTELGTAGHAHDFQALQSTLLALIGSYQESRQARFILDSMTEGLIIVSPQGRILSANKSILTMLGYEEENLIGQPFTDIYVKVKSVHVQGFFKRKQTYKEEELFKTIDGKVIPVRFSSSFLFDHNMEVQGFVCIAKDITKEKRAEEELQKQNDWFKITLASIADAVITTDTEGRINFCNDAARNLLNLTEASERKQLREVFHALELTTRVAVSIEEITARGESAKREQYLILNGDEERTIDLILAPIRSAEGLFHGTVYVLHDITQQRMAAAELREAKERAESALKVKSQFLAVMSHEIRTPMNGVVGMTDLLLGTALNPEQREIAEIISTSGESLLELLNHILDLSKIEAGKLVLDHCAFQPRKLFEEAVQLLSPRALAKNLQLNTQIAPTVPNTLIGDPGRLRQVLLNLVSNAIKFTESGEVAIELSLEQRNGDDCNLCCRVRDTGIGISHEAMTHLFDAFVQASPAITQKYGGTGLGLAICRELIDAMGGEIWATSEIDVGSIFSFRVMLKEDKAKALERPIFELDGLNLLLVEGNQSNRRAIAHQLEHLKCQVTLCELDEIHATLSAAAEDTFDILVLDYNQPVPNLAQFLIHLKGASAHFPGILLTTSMPIPPEEQDALNQIVGRCLTKPVKLAQLASAISAVLELRASAIDEPAHEPVLEPSTWILVAEDNGVNQKVTRSLLEKSGFKCEVAPNGLAVLEALKEKSYHLILMDCHMPELDGFETTLRIRQLKTAIGNIPIIAMTASSLAEDRERCIEVGMNGYLMKPIRKQALFEAVSLHLQQDQHVLNPSD